MQTARLPPLLVWDGTWGKREGYGMSTWFHVASRRVPACYAEADPLLSV